MTKQLRITEAGLFWLLALAAAGAAFLIWLGSGPVARLAPSLLT